MSKITDNCASFESTFPDDSKWENDEIVVPAGSALAAALRDALVNGGFDVSEPTPQEYYAWKIIASHGSTKITCLIHDLKPWLLTTAAKGSFWKKRDTMEFHGLVLGVLQKFLATDSRFSNVRWGAQGEVGGKSR